MRTELELLGGLSGLACCFPQCLLQLHFGQFLCRPALCRLVLFLFGLFLLPPLAALSFSHGESGGSAISSDSKGKRPPVGAIRRV